MITIGDVVSRVRNQMKAESEDAFVTDRYLYSLIKKYATLFMRRQDASNKLMKFNSVWQTLDFVDLIDVDKIESDCCGIKSDCTIKRTRLKLPTFMEGHWGPLIRTVSSIDGSINVQITSPGTYTAMANTTSFKYNKTKYFWWLNDYLYLPNVEWEAIKVEGIFEGDISKFNCDPSDNCHPPRHRQRFFVPEFLFAEIEQQVLQETFNTMKAPPEDADNKQNINR
tara:strand:+ start:1228 stop:1902 length:675 start_codon:yes stop_codon:yes gene_type:complete